MKRTIGIVLVCILLISAFFLGKHFGSAAKAAAPEDPAGQNLRISITSDYDAGFTSIPLTQGNHREITCLNVSNVIIDIDGTGMKLEDALLEGYISADGMIARARQDASLGFCRETAKSKNGLTEFTYHYPEFNLHYVYDLYETPDGRQHLITDFMIYDARSEPHFLYTFDETGNPIDYEDWGLRFEISSLDSSGITIKCSQSGGQQIGVLHAGAPTLFRKDPNTLALGQVQPLTEDGEPDAFTEITMGGTTDLSFDFAGQYGKLPAGDYVLSLQIVDWYNEEDVPPLTRNYHDEQWYDMEFTIS